MKLNRLLSHVLLFLFIPVIYGCGGTTSKDTNGSLTLDTPTSIKAGALLQAKATFTSPNGVQAVPITFTCTDPTVVLGSASDTNSSGVSTVQLRTRNIINGDRTVQIVASFGGVTASKSVTILANKLVFNSPESATFTVTAGNSMEYFISGGGTLIKYTDADNNPLSGQVVSLKVNSIVGLSDVVFHWGLANTSYLTTNPFSLTTLSDGSLPNSIVSLIASAPITVGVTSSYSANFIISVNDPFFGTMSISGDFPFSITAK